MSERPERNGWSRLGIAIAVVVAVGGLVLVAVAVLLAVGLSTWGSNK